VRPRGQCRRCPRNCKRRAEVHGCHWGREVPLGGVPRWGAWQDLGGVSAGRSLSCASARPRPATQRGLGSMSLATETTPAARIVHSLPAAAPQPAEPAYQVIRRNGGVSPFDQSKIAVALTKAFLAVERQ
jgi:hypothetical protein